MFAGALVTTSLVFLLLALAGTSADLLGASGGTGAFDWSGHARALPPVGGEPLPALFKAPRRDNDPLEYDTRPEGPPRDPALLPPEDETRVRPSMSPEEKAALEEQRRQAEAARQRKEAAQEIMNEGDKLLKRNQYPQAKETYLRAAKLEDSLKPEIAERFYEKGEQQERRRSWSRAQLLYRMSLHFDFENPKYHLSLAETSEALGDKKKAEEHRRLAEKFRAQGR